MNEDIWKAYSESFWAYTASRKKLLSTPGFLSFLKSKFVDPNERVVALSLLKSANEEIQREFLPELVGIASYHNGLEGDAREIILSFPKSWLISVIESATEKILKENNPQDYECLLPLFKDIDKQLYINLANRALRSSDPDVREKGMFAINAAKKR